MLLRFSIRNFRSFKDEQELSLIASGLKDVEGAIRASGNTELGVLRVLAMYGANASGKTAILRALSHMRSAVVSSQARWSPEGPIPFDCFALDEESCEQPSSFEVDILLDGTRYQYGFSHTAKAIVQEWLYAYPLRRRQLWFERRSEQFTFGKLLVGENRTIQKVTRPNSLFLSAAAQNNHEMLTPLHSWFAKKLKFITERGEASHSPTFKMCAGQGRERVEKMLTSADLGLAGVEVSTVDLDDEVKKIVVAFVAAAGLKDKGEIEEIQKAPHLIFRHRGADDKIIPLHEHKESHGTLAYFSLLGPVLTAIDEGAILCVDELDTSLHPLLALEFVKLFNDGQRNKNGAQLIFNTHDVNLLDPSVLRRDQVWFVEKDLSGASHLYPLTDFKPRKGENLQRGYLQGRYGAVPFLGKLPVGESEDAPVDAQ